MVISVLNLLPLISRNDALRKVGVLPPKPEDPEPQIEEALFEAKNLAYQNRLEEKLLDELDDVEDIEDEDFLNQYRQKRMEELKSFQHEGRFGGVQPLSKPDFVREVTEASEKVWVFVHLFKDE
jgi:hypothetical protein